MKEKKELREELFKQIDGEGFRFLNKRNLEIAGTDATGLVLLEISYQLKKANDLRRGR